MKPKPGRPALPATRKAITALVRKGDIARNTQGKVIDQRFAK